MDRPRVLVVDPDLKTQELIHKVLGKHSDIICQNHPLHLFELLELFEPDLLIVELDLPRLGGFELIGLVQGEPEPRPPIMVISARHDLETQKQVYRLGAEYFLAKPFKPSQLFKGVAMFVRRAGACARLAKRQPADSVRAWAAQPGDAEPMSEKMQRALAHQQHAGQSADGRRPARSVLASVANARPPQPGLQA